MVSQPYIYQRHELAEPDWRRFPGWAGVSAADWESAQSPNHTWSVTSTWDGAARARRSSRASTIRFEVFRDAARVD